jgi:hypothetical protein
LTTGHSLGGVNGQHVAVANSDVAHRDRNDNLIGAVARNLARIQRPNPWSKHAELLERLNWHLRYDAVVSFE